MFMRKCQIHQEKVTATLSQEQLEEIVIKYVSEQSGLKVDKSTDKNILFIKEDCGTSGFKTKVRIELTNNILPVIEGSSNPLPVEF